MIDLIESDETSTDLTTLPPADRAAVVLNSSKTEADLKQLATSLQAITTVNSPAGREQAHALAMTATKARVAIEKLGKAAREDATKFSKAVIAEENRLIAVIEPEETRVKGLRDAWDAAEAARKEAEAQKERDRIARHQAVIDQIKGYPALARDARTSAMALQMLNKLTAIDIEGLEEFKDAAHATMVSAKETINGIIEAKQTHEAEQARIKAEQEAEAARLAAERQRLEAERAEAARVQAEQQAELLAQQARMKAQQEELDRQAAEMARQAAELAARKAEAQAAEKPTAKLAEQPLEALAQIMPADIAAMLQAATPVIEAVPATPAPANEKGFSIIHGQAIPTAVDLANTIAYAQGVPQETAIRWLAHRADTFKTLAESQA